MVFEDTNAGVVSATTAGMMVIAVPNQFTVHQDFHLAKKTTSFTKFTIADLEKY